MKDIKKSTDLTALKGRAYRSMFSYDDIVHFLPVQLIKPKEKQRPHNNACKDQILP